MKRLALIFALISTPLVEAQPIHGQDVRPGISYLRRQGNVFLMSVYRLQQVQDECHKLSSAPKALQQVVVPFDGPGHEFNVDCEARRATLELAVRFYRSYDVTTACDKAPQSREVIVNQLGIDIPVDCQQRTEDLKLFEPWLRDR